MNFEEPDENPIPIIEDTFEEEYVSEIPALMQLLRALCRYKKTLVGKLSPEDRKSLAQVNLKIKQIEREIGRRAP